MYRRPIAVIGALCVSMAVIGAPTAASAPSGPVFRVEVNDLPALSEVPPLPPADGGVDETEDESDSSGGDVSGVQTAALILAVSVFVAGGLGLAMVTFRGRGAGAEDEVGRPGAAGAGRSL